MGSPSPNMILAKLVFAVLSLAQARADWTGTGEVKCYGHVSTNVLTPEGGGYLSEGDVTCSPAGSTRLGLGPRLCSSTLTRDRTLKSGRGTIMMTTCRLFSAMGISGIRRMTWGPGTVPRKRERRASLAVALPAVLETSPVLAADQAQSHFIYLHCSKIVNKLTFSCVI